MLWLWVQHEPGEVFAILWAWMWCVDSSADALTSSSQGINAFKREFSPCPVFFLFTYHSCRPGKAVGELSVGFWCSQSSFFFSFFSFCMLQGHCCVQERLFLFCIFSLKYMTFSDFFVRVKICQMAISDCLEIMKLWNLLKHKCQKKITAVSLASLVLLLDVNFPCLLMCAFCAEIKLKKDSSEKNVPPLFTI
mgnify:CR=1 FL=1